MFGRKPGDWKEFPERFRQRTCVESYFECLPEGQLSTKVDMEEHQSPVTACRKAFKDGTDAVHFIPQAIVVMATVKENKIPLQLVPVKETDVR